MTDYQLQGTGVLRLADNANIPNDPDNRDWRDYQDWLSLGNIPDPPSIQLTLIPCITKRQMLIWLYITLGKVDKDVQMAIQTISDVSRSTITLITWLNPDSQFNRDDPIINELAPLFGLKVEQMDQAFIEASKL